MSIYRTWITAKRVLTQLFHDYRTLGMIVMIPCLLMVLLKYIFDSQPQVFNMVAVIMLGIFPLFMMFLIASIATLRERELQVLLTDS